MTTVYGPRHRSESWSKPAIADWGEYDRYGNLLKAYPIPYDSASYLRDMHDVVTEDYKMKIARGDIVNNPMRKVVEIVNHRPSFGNIRFSDGDDQKEYHSVHTINPVFNEVLRLPNLDLQAYKDRAVTEAYARANSKELQSLVTLGELRETKEMFLSAVSKLHNVQKHLRYWDYLRRRTLNWRDLRDAWMEVRFGWRPFVSEVKGYLAAQDKLHEYPPRQTFRETVPIPLQEAADIVTVTAGPNIWEVARYTTMTGRVSAGVMCNQRYAGFPDTYGLWDIPGTVWELTKLSWFVDYFFDAGKVIASWTPDTLWNPIAAWVVVRTDETFNWSVHSHKFSDSRFTGGVSGETFQSRVKTTERFPDPQRKFIPQFLPKLNWAKYVDTVALASQVWEKTKSILGRPVRRR